MAKLAPVVAVSFVVGAYLLGGRWPMIAAAGAALLTALVSVLVFRIDRRRRVEVGAVRARVAADYAAEHSRYAGEHRAFTAHLVSLLDAASSRIGLLRHRIDWLEGELAANRMPPSRGAEPGTELARFADTTEWAELWPDLAEAPTVVDLVAWDERARGELLDYGDDEPQQRTA